jgi:hypothetical protein
VPGISAWIRRRVIANTIRDLPPDLALDIEGFLAEQAALLTVAELKAVAAEVLAAAAPEQSDKDTASKRAAQQLCLSRRWTACGAWTAGSMPKPA